MNEIVSMDESSWQVWRPDLLKRLGAAASVPLAASLRAHAMDASVA